MKDFVRQLIEKGLFRKCLPISSKFGVVRVYPGALDLPPSPLPYKGPVNSVRQFSFKGHMDGAEHFTQFHLNVISQWNLYPKSSDLSLCPPSYL